MHSREQCWQQITLEPTFRVACALLQLQEQLQIVGSCFNLLDALNDPDVHNISSALNRNCSNDNLIS